MLSDLKYFVATYRATNLLRRRQNSKFLLRLPYISVQFAMLLFKNFCMFLLQVVHNVDLTGMYASKTSPSMRGKF